MPAGKLLFNVFSIFENPEPKRREQRLKTNSTKPGLLLGLMMFCLAFPPLFSGLGDLPIRVFDEARNIINAIEMSHSGNFLITTYHGKPEMWSSKPPLFTWCMVICIKACGLSEFSVRLPSATAAIITVLSVFHFTRRIASSLHIAFYASMILLCAEGFAADHTARTADYDSMLLMWSFLSAMLFFTWSKSQNTKELNLAFLFLALAVLTKSAAGFLTFPGIMVYLLFFNENKKAVLSKKFLVASLLFLLPVMSFYLLRETQNHGYLKAVWENEFGGRYIIALDAHEHGFWYYAENFIKERMSIWIWPAILGFLFIPLIKEKEQRSLALFALLVGSSVFLIISTAGTKLFWYDLPIYPWLAISAAIALHKLIGLTDKIHFLPKHSNLKFFIIAIFVFVVPYRNLLAKNIRPTEKKEEKSFYDLSHYLQKISKDNKQQQSFTIYYTYAEFFYEFYQHLNRPPEFQILKDPEFNTGDHVIHHVPATGKILDSLYICRRIQKIGEYEEVKIISRK